MRTFIVICAASLLLCGCNRSGDPGTIIEMHAVKQSTCIEYTVLIRGDVGGLNIKLGVTPHLWKQLNIGEAFDTSRYTTVSKEITPEKTR